MLCYAAPDWSIASLVFFPWFYLEADSMFALAFTDKMAKKNLISTKKQQELKFFYAPRRFARSIITWTVIFRG